MRFPIFILLMLAFHPLLSQEKAEVSGRILDENNQGLPFANIYIEEILKGTTADEDGYYLLNQIPFGTREITVSAVGYSSAKRTLRIEKEKISNIDFRLSFDNHMEQVEIFGNRNNSPDKLESITGLPLKPYEQIQSISVLSGKLIEDQGALSIADATKNVPGVYSFATYGNKRESMSSRGFRGIPILKNGVRIHSDFRGVGILTDMQGVDNIQILKGTASITQGVATDLGSPGGIINIVTKTPKYNHGGSVSLRGGSYGQVRPTFDFFGPLNKTKNLAYRLNGALERADSYRHLVEKESFYFNPSFAWKIDERTSLTVEVDHYYDSRTPDIGTVNLADTDVNAIYDMPYSQFLGYENDRSVTENTNYAIRMDHQLNDKLTLKGAFYSSSLDLDDKGAGLGKAIKIGDETHYNLRQRNYAMSTRSDKNSVLQFDLVGKEVYTGSIHHVFQVGMDYRMNSYKTENRAAGVLDTINVFQHIPTALPAFEINETTITHGKVNALGLIVQDVITWNSWMKTFMGIRYSSTETRTEVESLRSHAFNPLGGVIFTPIEHINVFASYTNSSYPRTAARLGENGEALGNERFDQFETGIKTSWLNDRLRFNFTYYKINNKNMNLPVYDETWANILYYAKGGNDQRQGIEVELTGRPLPNLEVIGGYSYIDAQYKDHTSFVYGSAPLNTPKHTFNGYVNYWFRSYLKGLSLGAGVYYTGKRPINDWSKGPVTHQGIVPGQKPFDVDAYTTVNVQSSYRINDHWSVQLVVNNLFNAKGYNAYRTSFINPIDPTTFAGVIRYTL